MYFGKEFILEFLVLCCFFFFWKYKGGVSPRVTLGLTGVLCRLTPSGGTEAVSTLLPGVRTLQWYREQFRHRGYAPLSRFPRAQPSPSTLSS